MELAVNEVFALGALQKCHELERNIRWNFSCHIHSATNWSCVCVALLSIAGVTVVTVVNARHQNAMNR